MIARKEKESKPPADRWREPDSISFEPIRVDLTSDGNVLTLEDFRDRVLAEKFELSGTDRVALYKCPQYIIDDIDTLQELDDYLKRGITSAYLLRAGLFELLQTKEVTTYLKARKLAKITSSIAMNLRAELSKYCGTMAKPTLEFVSTCPCNSSDRFDFRCSTDIKDLLTSTCNKLGMSISSLGIHSLALGLLSIPNLVHKDLPAIVISDQERLLEEISNRTGKLEYIMLYKGNGNG